jgi:hypothetical protein
VTSTPPTEKRQITTWQRQWGGGRLKHGPETDILGGQTLSITTYRHGKKHGPYLGYTLSTQFKGTAMQLVGSSEPTTRGQYLNDTKDGIWVTKRENSTRTEHWRNNRLDGPTNLSFSDGKEVNLLFAKGRLMSVNGKSAVNRLYELLREKGTIDTYTALELESLTTIDAKDMQLRDLCSVIADTHNLRVTLDGRHLLDSYEQPVTCNLSGVDLCSALTVIAAEYNLGCDYRYGIVWIPSAADARDWHDPAGVSEIQPPKGIALARAWNEATSADPINQQLASVLAEMAQPLAIEIDSSRLLPTEFGVTARIAGLSFRHALGVLLYNMQCRCELEGDKLVILPP